MPFDVTCSSCGYTARRPGESFGGTCPECGGGPSTAYLADGDDDDAGSSTFGGPGSEMRPDTPFGAGSAGLPGSGEATAPRPSDDD